MARQPSLREIAAKIQRINRITAATGKGAAGRAKAQAVKKSTTKAATPNAFKAPSIKTGTTIKRPKRPKAPKGLTMDEILALTKMHWPTRFKNAKRDRVTIVAFRANKSKIVSKSLTYDASGGSPGKPMIRPHKHWIEKHPEDLDKPFRKARVLWNCDCPDAMYRFEYVMSRKYGAAKEKFCNGQFPIMTNPKKKGGACKHAVVLFSYCKQNKF